MNTFRMMTWDGFVEIEYADEFEWAGEQFVIVRARNRHGWKASHRRTGYNLASSVWGRTRKQVKHKAVEYLEQVGADVLQKRVQEALRESMALRP